MKRAITFFLMQVAVYLLLVFNFRAVADGHYIATVLSDGLIAFFAFAVVKRISEAKRKIERVGYVLGSAAGSALGIFISKQLGI